MLVRSKKENFLLSQSKIIEAWFKSFLPATHNYNTPINLNDFNLKHKMRDAAMKKYSDVQIPVVW